MILQVTGLITGVFIGAIARLDPLAGMSMGLTISSVNFGVSLSLKSKP